MFLLNVFALWLSSSHFFKKKPSTGSIHSLGLFFTSTLLGFFFGSQFVSILQGSCKVLQGFNFAFFQATPSQVGLSAKVQFMLRLWACHCTLQYNLQSVNLQKSLQTKWTGIVTFLQRLVEFTAKSWRNASGRCPRVLKESMTTAKTLLLCAKAVAK